MAYPGPSQFIQFLATWTSALIDVAPNWMQQRPNAVNGAKFLYSLILSIDVQLENTLQAINDWAPGSPDASVTALPLIGQSRGLIQGEAETNAQFGVRLQGWRPVTKQTGKSEILAQQIQRYLGNNPLVRIIERIYGTTTARYVTANTNGTTSSVVAAWDWDSVSGWTDGSASYPGMSAFANWQAGHVYARGNKIITPQNGSIYQATAVAGTGTSGATSPNFPDVLGASVVDNAGPNQITWTAVASDRAFTLSFWSDLWIVVYPCEWPITGTNLASLVPIWGKSTLGLGHQVGRTAFDAIRTLVAQWKGIHTFVRAIIWSYDATLFDPATPGAAGNPDGTWGNAYKMVGGAMVASRTGNADGRVRYWLPPNG